MSTASVHSFCCWLLRSVEAISRLPKSRLACWKSSELRGASFTAWVRADARELGAKKRLLKSFAFFALDICFCVNPRDNVSKSEAVVAETRLLQRECMILKRIIIENYSACLVPLVAGEYQLSMQYVGVSSRHFMTRWSLSRSSNVGSETLEDRKVIGSRMSGLTLVARYSNCGCRNFLNMS